MQREECTQEKTGGRTSKQHIFMNYGGIMCVLTPGESPFGAIIMGIQTHLFSFFKI